AALTRSKGKLMKILHPQRKRIAFLCLASSAFILLLIEIIPVRIGITFYLSILASSYLNSRWRIRQGKVYCSICLNYRLLQIWVFQARRLTTLVKFFVQMEFRSGGYISNGVRSIHHLKIAF
ncbi:MAG: hypothetical protein AB1861_15060, partial [Cyanobacteriota bacterium]